MRPSARSSRPLLDARHHAVAVHRLVQVRAGDEDVARRPPRPACRESRSRTPAGASARARRRGSCGRAGRNGCRASEPGGRPRRGPCSRRLTVARCSRGIFSRCSSSRAVAGCSTLSRMAARSCSLFSIGNPFYFSQPAVPRSTLYRPCDRHGSRCRCTPRTSPWSGGPRRATWRRSASWSSATGGRSSGRPWPRSGRRPRPTTWRRRRS